MLGGRFGAGAHPSVRTEPYQCDRTMTRDGSLAADCDNRMTGARARRQRLAARVLIMTD